ncbi:hypothetical protein [Tropicimonas sp. S265A]|uniref:hypothetical protein n=1 Tax=Tropicimonas sp. S265A TaxID=3415134 RepID=UPI003C7EA30B
MGKTVFVLFATIAATLALSSGVFALSLGERSAEAILALMLVAMLAALPISWFFAKSRFDKAS